MGWQEVGKVPAAFRVRGPRSLATTLRARVPAELWSLPLDIGVPFTEWLEDAGHEVEEPTAKYGPREIVTDRSRRFSAWRYGNPLLGYRALAGEHGTLVVRGRQRGGARELVLADTVGFPSERTDATAARALGTSDCDYLLRCGHPNAQRGFIPLPGGGPVLAFRSLNVEAVPPFANWQLSMGDAELF
jgi:hypothetical protein